MELRRLATFVAVAEEGSFTRASDRLNVAQSAVSASIRNLERELDARLFDRTTHHVQLTDAGHALLPEARATLAAATAARDAVDAVRGGVRGTVLLGTMQAQGMRAIDVPDLLATFRATYPDVEVQIRHAAGGSAEMAAGVRDGRLDLAFVAITAGPPGVEVTTLAREPIMLITPTTHPLAAHRKTILAAVADQPLAGFPEGWGVRTANDRALATAGLIRTVTYEVNDTASVIGFVRRGLAVTMLPASMIDAPDGLALTPIRDHHVQFTTALATPSNRRLTAAADALVHAIKTRAPVPPASGNTEAWESDRTAADAS